MPPIQQPQNNRQQPVGNTGAPTYPNSDQNPQQVQQEKPKPKNPNSTQNTLIFSEIRDNMVIMNDGSFRVVIACESINFDLMSSQEREGVEFNYQNFLNSLYFPIQVFIRSQRVDIGPYIDRLINIRRNQDNMLLNVLMDDYINFIDILSQEANIMDKSFYIIAPFYPSGDVDAIKEQTKGFLNSIFGNGGNQTGTVKVSKDTYAKAKDELRNRIDVIVGGLAQIGVRSAPLNTKELGKLYYNFYNPDTAIREPLGDFDQMASTFVMKGQGEASRPHLGEGF